MQAILKPPIETTQLTIILYHYSTLLRIYIVLNLGSHPSEKTDFIRTIVVSCIPIDIVESHPPQGIGRDIFVVVVERSNHVLNLPRHHSRRYFVGQRVARLVGWLG